MSRAPAVSAAIGAIARRPSDQAAEQREQRAAEHAAARNSRTRGRSPRRPRPCAVLDDERHDDGRGVATGTLRTRVSTAVAAGLRVRARRMPKFGAPWSGREPPVALRTRMTARSARRRVEVGPSRSTLPTLSTWKPVAVAEVVDGRRDWLLKSERTREAVSCR
jgi:hypothetical protein